MKVNLNTRHQISMALFLTMILLAADWDDKSRVLPPLQYVGGAMFELDINDL